ncbi:MAG TPA: DUF6171 family protein [Ruminiclostridium sp.]|nr:DUF6171 family protein [Ruminiclostridium sp.]
MKDKCIKCHGSIHIPDEDIEKEIRRVVDSGLPLATDAQYNRRLQICNSCEQLLDGTTCRICGCIVRVRALYALRICPHSSGSRW